MLASELIDRIEKIIKKHGDVEVLVYDDGFASQTEIEEIVFEETDDDGIEKDTISLQIDF